MKRSIESGINIYYKIAQLLIIPMVCGYVGSILSSNARILQSFRAPAIGLMVFSDYNNTYRAYTALADRYEGDLKPLLEKHQETDFARWAQERLEKTGQSRSNRYVMPWPDTESNPVIAASTQCYFSDGSPLEIIAFSQKLIELVAPLLEQGLDYPSEPLNRLAATIDHEVGHLKHNHGFNQGQRCIERNVMAFAATCVLQRVHGVVLYAPVSIAVFIFCRAILKQIWSHYNEFQADANTSLENIPYAICDRTMEHEACLSKAKQVPVRADSVSRYLANTFKRWKYWTAITPPFDILHDHPAPQRRIARLKEKMGNK